MLVNCKIIKQVFYNLESNFRVLACEPINSKENNKIQTNKYGNFTLSGSNLDMLPIGQEIELDLIEDTQAKYPATYKLLGVGGIALNNKTVDVNPYQEYKILSGFMTSNQAKNVNNAYPNFISLILNGRENEIDYKKIKNVGPVYLESYINKIKSLCRSILFVPVAFDYGIESSDIINELSNIYETPDDLKEAFDKNPYHIYLDLAHYPFSRTDKLVLKKFPELIDSFERCEYGCIEILKRNELYGNTRMSAKDLSYEANELVPEAINHVLKAVTECNLIHYDTNTKTAALKGTYEAEKYIANDLRNRAKEANKFPVDWKNFKNINGLSMTDEQSEILHLVSEYNVMMLTGSGGTGKSTSIKALINMLETSNKTYILLAPTGIASKKLKESTERNAMTIHMFLARNEIAGEYVIIDEMSMVGVELLYMLLKHLKKENKIIFVCDESQLASISCGNIVQDIIDSKLIPRANLTKVFRYGEGGIATMATDARMGTFNNSDKQYPDFEMVQISDDPIKQILDCYEKYLNMGYHHEDILILSPFNKGDIGTYVINNAIQSRYNHYIPTDISYERKIKGNTYKLEFKINDKVLNTKNNYKIQKLEYNDNHELTQAGTVPIMNGDIGYVLSGSIGIDGKPELVIQFDTGIAQVVGSDVSNIILGYAVSIHKIQGAQSKVVIVVVDKSHKNMLSRNLLYVALSRAQEQMTLISDTSIIQDCLEIQENKDRNTWLKDMLIKGVEQ